MAEVAYVAHGDGVIPFSGPGAKEAALKTCRNAKSPAGYWTSIEAQGDARTLADSLPPPTGEIRRRVAFWREMRRRYRVLGPLP